jgi:phosphoribosylformylglycinamidine synthase subunit PurL
MLNKLEEKAIHDHIKRQPTKGEYATIDALWSEHCSYKSSKRWFHLFNTESPRVYLGIGEGAGLIDIGDDYLIGLGLESHNHPSAVDPFNGAATGVGGIIRDIVSQGCKPVAVLDCLRFGNPTNARQKLLLDQVVLGISSYGNCVGIPNLGGDTEFSNEFSGNPLVNAMCVGVAKKDEIIRSIAKVPGDILLLFGSTTGRDGIGGVTFASEDLNEQQEESRGSVQIGDPLTEKLLIDAIMEMRDRKLLNGLQDLGGGGLACAAAEMSEKGSTGVHLNLEKVPVKATDMQGWEILVSESQERMLAIISPERLDEITQILDKLELNWSVVGVVTDTKKFVADFHGENIANIDVDFLINGFPLPERSVGTPPKPEVNSVIKTNIHPLEYLLSTYNLASRKPIYQQYDQHVQGNTSYGAGRDAGVIHLPNKKYLAIAAGTNSYMISRNPRIGSILATMNIVRSVIIRGAEPIGLVDSINAGNPEKSDSYGEFVDVIKGVAEVSHEMKIPVVGGNVSLYNETELSGKRHKILTSPFVGIAGLIENEPIPEKLEPEESEIFLIGNETGHLDGSEYQRVFGGDSTSMEIDWALEKSTMKFIFEISDHILAATDIAKGGLAITLAKWAIQSRTGIELTYKNEDLSYLWGEFGPRYLIQINPDNKEKILNLAGTYDIPIKSIGKTSNDSRLILDKSWDLKDLRDLWENPIEEALKV